jgi:hypothetical protein
LITNNKYLELSFLPIVYFNFVGSHCQLVSTVIRVPSQATWGHESFKGKVTDGDGVGDDQKDFMQQDMPSTSSTPMCWETHQPVQLPEPLVTADSTHKLVANLQMSGHHTIVIPFLFSFRVRAFIFIAVLEEGFSFTRIE